MGASIAGIFASFGAAEVFAVSRDLKDAEVNLQRIARSVKADSIYKRIHVSDYSGLDDCVANSDLVFESVLEDRRIKKDIAVQVSKCLKKDAYFCTGTSGLSVTELAECFPCELRGNVFGVHFFNCNL